MTVRGLGLRVFAHRLRLRVAAFGRDDRGSVALQTIIFSLLLFGTAGLVLDSGRVYATHSQMQAFADQMSLVAANELDGRDDAIQRAANAVFGFDGSLPFLEKAGLEVGDFVVQSVDFYSTMAPSSRMQNDMTEAFPYDTRLATASGSTPEYLSGDAAAASHAALYAVVKVARKEMRSTLAAFSMPIVNMAETDPYVSRKGPIFEEKLHFDAVAAASMERTTCADISTLVLCNPWENISPSPLDTPEDDPGYSIPGRSLMYFAPNYSGLGIPASPVISGTMHGSLYPWTVQNELFKLVSPLSDPAGLCSADYLMTLAGEDVTNPADYIKARDRCLMARARNARVCWSDRPGSEMTIAPADGDMVSRSLNTIFDNWLPPFRQFLSQNVAVGDTGLTRSQFYEPDALDTTTYETADRHGVDPDPKQDGVPDYVFPPACTSAADCDTFSVAYDTVPMPGMAMLYRVHGLGIGYDICHANTYRKYTTGIAGGACTHDFIGDYYDGGTTNYSTTMSRLRSYFQNMYGVSAATLPLSVDTWYKMYEYERANFGTLNTYDQWSRVQQWSDANTSLYGLASNNTKYVKQGPDEYLHLTGAGSLLNPGYERRRVRSAFVNCGATVAKGTNEDGSYTVSPDDVRVMDVYLPEPPGIFCGTNEIGCSLEDSVETRQYIELIDDVTEDSVQRRYVAQLVR